MQLTDSQLAEHVRANRYDVLSRLADDLAHEIKNPLNAIVVNLEVLRRRIENGSLDAALERANVIEDEIRRVHGLVEQLLQLMRPSKVDVGPTAIDGLLDGLSGAMKLQAKAARVEFSYESESSLYAQVKPEALQFALLNLISAAIDSVTDSGRVALRVTRGASAIELEIVCDGAVLKREDSAVRLCSDLIEAAGGNFVSLEPHKGAAGSTVRLHVPPARFS